MIFLHRWLENLSSAKAYCHWVMHDQRDAVAGFVGLVEISSSESSDRSFA